MTTLRWQDVDLTIEEAMETYFRVFHVMDGATLDAVVEPMTIEPVQRLTDRGYSFDGFDVTAEVLQVTQATGVYDMVEYEATVYWKFDPNRSNGAPFPWDEKVVNEFNGGIVLAWYPLDPRWLNWCPVCDDRMIAPPDYLCQPCRYGE